MTGPGTETSRAVTAVARILRAPPSTDPDVTAAHIVAALKGHGWRPTPAAPAVPWQAQTSQPLPEHRNRELAAQARQAINQARRAE